MWYALATLVSLVVLVIALCKVGAEVDKLMAEWAQRRER